MGENTIEYFVYTCNCGEFCNTIDEIYPFATAEDVWEQIQREKSCS